MWHAGLAALLERLKGQQPSCHPASSPPSASDMSPRGAEQAGQATRLTSLRRSLWCPLSHQRQRRAPPGHPQGTPRTPPGHVLHLRMAGGQGGSASLQLFHPVPTLLQPNSCSLDKSSFSPQFWTCSKIGLKEVPGEHGRAEMPQVVPKIEMLGLVAFIFLKHLKKHLYFLQLLSSAGTLQNWIPYYGSASVWYLASI